MNLILLFPSDFVVTNIVSLTGRRLAHVLEILKPEVGDVLVVGIEAGNMGRGKVLEIHAHEMRLEVVFSEPPPLKLPVILCMALMRPIVLRRALLTAVSMGVEKIILFHSGRVEKSFWQSVSLKDAAIRDQLILGLEQAKDTIMPEVVLEKRFKFFVEDLLPGLLIGREGVVADPSGQELRIAFPSDTLISSNSRLNPKLVIIGPEGGFLPYEIERLVQLGCRNVSLGPRILRVETAMVALLSRMIR